MPFPELRLDLVPPGRMTMPNIIGGAVEGGRSLSGIALAADLTGGGFVAVKYSNIILKNTTSDALRYWSWLCAYLAGGRRSILVPMLIDYVDPLPELSLFSDGSTFSDGSLFSISGGFVVLNSSASVNAGTIVIRASSGANIDVGQWFEFSHAEKSARSYNITEIDSVTTNGSGTKTYTVGIRPPLRAAVPSGMQLRFRRPRCLMRLAPGSNPANDVEKYWQSTAEISFVESFGTV